MNKIQIGKIVTTHGIKGEIKVLSYTNIDNLFNKINQIWIDDKIFNVEYVKYIKNCPILKLKEIEAPEEAMPYIGHLIFISEDSLPELNKNDYYVKDILGSSAYDEYGNLIGKLTNVFFTGANDVYEITTVDNKTALIPAVKEFVLDIDIANKSIKLHIIEGMI